MRIIDKYIPVREFANKFGYSPQAIVRMIKEGRLDGEKIGYQWLIPKTAVEKFESNKRERG